MGMINKRLFGSPIPENIKKKLEERQKKAAQPSPNESIAPVFPRGGDLYAQGELSSRTPFARMWVSLEAEEVSVQYNVQEEYEQSTVVPLPSQRTLDMIEAFNDELFKK